MYKVEKLTVRNDGSIETTIVFEHEDLNKAMKYWESYASGVNDVDTAYGDAIEFVNQTFSDAHYYRIINDNTASHLLLLDFTNSGHSYSIVQDSGQYTGTKPELNIRAIKTIYDLDKLTFYNINNKLPEVEALIKEIEENSEDVGRPYCNGILYSLTAEQEQALIEANEQQEREEKIEELQNEIDIHKRTIDEFNKAKNPPETIAESRERARKYNELNNEGGYGFVPRFVSREQAEKCKARIAELQDELKEIKGE